MARSDVTKRLRARQKFVLVRQLVLWAKDRPCRDCGGTFPFYVMDFDHRDGTEKNFELSGVGPRPVATVVAEIAKCDVVCANCHRTRTYRRRYAK